MIAPRWTPAEDVLALRDLPLAVIQQDLPERTIVAISNRRRHLRGTVTPYRRPPAVPTTVPIMEVRELVMRQLEEHNLTREQLAVASRVSTKGIWVITSLSGKRINMPTYDRLKTLPYLHEVRRSWLPAKATELRLKALAMAGYSVQDIAWELGQSAMIGKPTAKVVLRSHAQKILDLIIRLDGRVGPSPQAITKAANKGWRHEREYRRERFLDIEWSGRGGSARASDVLLENLDFLLGCGLTVEAAWVRAGYRTLSAAEQALVRRDARDQRGSQAA
jgi:hypothetical protein